MGRSILGVCVALAFVACGPVASEEEHKAGQPAGKADPVEEPGSCHLLDSDPELILGAIGQAKSCYEAAGIAEICSWGSSIDVQFVSAAMPVCEAGFASMPEVDRENYRYLQEGCAKKYENEMGTMYRSATAYCQLEVAKTYNSFYATAAAEELEPAEAEETSISLIKPCPVSDGMDAEAIEQAITSASSCYQAVDLAERCAFGSSMDMQFVDSATTICQSGFSPLADQEQVIYDDLNQKCVKKYENESGTMYLSMMAFCQLQVTRMFDAVFSEVL